MTYTYSITCVDDGSGPEFDTFEEAEAACRAFLRGGVDCGGLERVCEDDFDDAMVIEIED